MFLLILPLMFIIVVVVSLATFAFYMTHVGMVKNNNKVYGKASYSVYLKEFNKYNWSNEDSVFKTSLWDRKNNCELHADIITFNGIGMIMKTPWDYWMMKYHLYSYCKSLEQKQKQNYYQWQ